MLSDEAETFPATHGVLDSIDSALLPNQTLHHPVAGPLPVECERQRTNLVTLPRSIAIRDVRGHQCLLNICII